MLHATGARVVRAQTTGPVPVTAVIWRDRNGDGIRQADEPPLPGVEVIIGRTGSLERVAQPVTDANGAIATSIPTGEYQACFLVTIPRATITNIGIAGDTAPWANRGGNCSNVFTATSGRPIALDVAYREPGDQILAITGAPTGELVTSALVLVTVGVLFLERTRRVVASCRPLSRRRAPAR